MRKWVAPLARNRRFSAPKSERRSQSGKILDAGSLRILHIAPFLSQDGSFGGPMAVAEEACVSLASLGHDVVLATGWDGKARLDASGPLIVYKRGWQLSSRTFASLVSPSLLFWFLRHGKEFDVVHVHLSRDLTTLPIAILGKLIGRPPVLQTHGMIQPHRHKAVRFLDWLVTRRALRSATAVLALTPTEIAGLAEICGSTNLGLTTNPAPQTTIRATWSSMPKAVYLSRLAKRKNPVAFVEAAGLLLSRDYKVEFELWGSDEGELANVRRAIADCGLHSHCIYRGAGPRSNSLDVLGSAQVFVLPSFGEVVPMAALEAMAVGLPLVLTYDSGISSLAGQAGAAVITDGSAEAIADGIALLVSDEATWRRASEAALLLAQTAFSPSVVTAELVKYYLHGIE